MGKWTETLDWTGMTSKNSKMKRPVAFVQNGMTSLLLFLVDEKPSAATGHTASAGTFRSKSQRYLPHTRNRCTRDLELDSGSVGVPGVSVDHDKLRRRHIARGADR